MDSLRNIIVQLSKQEVREFKYFLSRNGRKESVERKDVQLLNLYRKYPEDNADKIVTRLYKSTKKTAYHHLREDLRRSLEDFMWVQQSKNDSFSTVIRLLASAHFLTDKRMPEVWDYLRKAEKKAIRAEQYELLNMVYSMQVEYAYVTTADPQDEILNKRKENLKLAKLDGSLNVANHLIRKQVIHSHLSGDAQNIDQIVDEVLAQFGIVYEDISQLKLRHRLIRIAARSMHENGSYDALFDYLEKEYGRMKKEDAFSRLNFQTQLDMLRLLCFASLKVFENELCQKYLDEYLSVITKYKVKDAEALSHYLKYVTTLYVTDRKLLNKGIKLLADFLSETGHRLSKLDRSMHEINLASFYFYNEQYNKSVKILASSHGHDAKRDFVKEFGQKIALNIELFECVLHYELCHYDFVYHRVVSIERRYNRLLLQTDFEADRLFLYLLKQMCHDPDIVTYPEFIIACEAPSLHVIALQGTGRIVECGIWLNSKIQKRSYQELFYEKPRYTR
jgi:hypothetical protein